MQKLTPTREILADQNMDQLVLDVGDASATYTQQVVVSSKHNDQVQKSPLLSQLSKSNKSRLRSDQTLRTLIQQANQ